MGQDITIGRLGPLDPWSTPWTRPACVEMEIKAVSTFLSGNHLFELFPHNNVHRCGPWA
jgi:hypothetical protein